MIRASRRAVQLPDPLTAAFCLEAQTNLCVCFDILLSLRKESKQNFQNVRAPEGFSHPCSTAWSRGVAEGCFFIS